MTVDWTEIASSYIEEGKLNKAINIYKKKLGFKKVPSETMISWGDLALGNKKYKAAFRAYRLSSSVPKLKALQRHLEETGNPSLAESVSAYLVIGFSE